MSSALSRACEIIASDANMQISQPLLLLSYASRPYPLMLLLLKHVHCQLHYYLH